MGDKNMTVTEWMLNSGASDHFTGDINDFVEYETLSKPTVVHTANAQTSVVGKGTVVLQIKNKVIHPILYIPDLTTRLFSLGQFHVAGLHSRGSAKEISVHEGDEEFLTFYP